MRRRLAAVLLALVVLPVAAAPASAAGRTSLHLQATYDATLRLRWDSRRIRVGATIAIHNTSGGPIDRVELNTIAAKLGAMDLRSVTVDGRAVRATTPGQTIVVPLGRTLAAGEATTVRVVYRARLRSGLGGSDWMFTRANGIADLYRWLPWVSRRTPFERPNHGDPFVTPSSAFVRVRVDADRRLVLATTGERVSSSADGRTQVFEARDVRDFTITAARDYRTRTRTVGDTVVRVLHRPGAGGRAMLDAAADALAAIEAKLGPYPRRVLTVAQSSGRYGMESPGLVWIPTGTPRANLRYLAAHEIAHQWFYGLVGNDQARRPFADEAAADMVARHVTGTRRASRCSAGRLDRSIYHYGATCYYERIYIQGGGLLDQARRLMGGSTYWAALRGYLAAHRNGLATTRDLLDALDDATSVDLRRRLFEARFPSLY